MYSEITGFLFCVLCMLFCGTTKLATIGFENNPKHKSCIITITLGFSYLGRVDGLLPLQLDDEKKYWRNILYRVTAAVHALASHDLEFRRQKKFGLSMPSSSSSSSPSTSSSCGNFIMAMKLIAQFDSFLAEHIRKFRYSDSGHTSYLSSTTFEQLIKIIANEINIEVIKDVKQARYFSIIVDSTPDVAHIDEFSFILRYVNVDGYHIEIFEIHPKCRSWITKSF